MENIEKIISTCAANAFRSPGIEVFTRARLKDLGREEIEVVGRGVKADYYTDVVAGKKEMPSDYVVKAVGRVVAQPGNYSEETAARVNEGQYTEELARKILHEEREKYKTIIAQYCLENNLELPREYHQQFQEQDADRQTEILIASENEANLLEEKHGLTGTILGIQDELGGNYKQKKLVLDEMKEMVYDTVPTILR